MKHPTDEGFSLRLVTEEEAAKLLATPRGTLRYWRHQGTGPNCIRLGRCIKYDIRDLEAFVDARRVGSSVNPSHHLTGTHGYRRKN